MRNLLLTLSFDGSEFHGWQMQKNAITVQQVLSDAIFKASGERVVLHGCSRTDARFTQICSASISRPKAK